MAKAKKAAKSKVAPSFEEALDELELLTEKLEEEQLPLDKMVKAFERGQDLLNFCQKSLTSARESIELIEARQAKADVADEISTQPAEQPATTDDDVRLF